MTKNRKVPGPDKILTEILKPLGDNAIMTLTGHLSFEANTNRVA